MGETVEIIMDDNPPTPTRDIMTWQNSSSSLLVNAIVDRLQADHVDLRQISLGEMKRLIREAQVNRKSAAAPRNAKLAT